MIEFLFLLGMPILSALFPLAIVVLLFRHSRVFRILIYILFGLPLLIILAPISIFYWVYKKIELEFHIFKHFAWFIHILIFIGFFLFLAKYSPFLAFIFLFGVIPNIWVCIYGWIKYPYLYWVVFSDKPIAKLWYEFLYEEAFGGKGKAEWLKLKRRIEAYYSMPLEEICKRMEEKEKKKK